MNAPKHTKRTTHGRADGQDLLTKDDLAKRLRLTRRGVECLVARRVIPVIRLSRRCVRFDFEAVKIALSKLTIREIGR